MIKKHLKQTPREMAMLAALRSDMHVFKNSAVIVDRDGNVITTGVSRKDARWNFIEAKSVHAERDVIDKVAIRKLDGATIITCCLVFNRNRYKLHCAKPCPSCENLIRKTGIRYIIYSTTRGWIKIDLKKEEK